MLTALLLLALQAAQSPAPLPAPAFPPAPASPPAPAQICATPTLPEPCPQLIFFDSSADAPRPEWIAVLDSAARDRGDGAIVFAAFSDRSGPAPANLAIARKRAEAIRRLLIERGVPASAIRTTSFGEDQPLVPTPDGVMEPQNRRVEIRILAR